MEWVLVVALQQQEVLHLHQQAVPVELELQVKLMELQH
jgi:hypothetical protein